MYNYHLTRVSNNAKTGPIPVSTTSRASCPDTCGIKEVCYADLGPLKLHWDKVSDGSRGISLIPFAQEIRKLPRNQLWRHNQAGDLPHREGVIDHDSVWELVTANQGRRGFTYTHHERGIHNMASIRGATAKGFTINLSFDTVQDAVDGYYDLGYKAITALLPIDVPNVQIVDDVKIVACPAEKSDRVTCATCELCYDSNRDYIIGFRAHGTRKRAADIIARA